MHIEHLKEKWKEALSAVAPIILLVLVLTLFFVPMPGSLLLAYLFGSVMLLAGMMLFNMGAEQAMSPMGERLGAALTGTRKLALILSLGFLLGVLITVAEPDLQVLADQVPSIPGTLLILSVALGVGLFLAAALGRMLFAVGLRWLLIGCYALVFLLALFVPRSFLAVAFDAGGVTTGPMTVPFIMAFGVGVSAVRSDEHAAEDSFGLVALCSVGPILAVLLLGLFCETGGAEYVPAAVPEIADSVSLRVLFQSALPRYMGEIARSLLPIVLVFLICNFSFLHAERRVLLRILVGLGYVYVGLVLFLTGANVGFLPTGIFLGRALAELDCRWVVAPLGMLMGFFIVRAEPAVYVLMHQVEEITDGAVSGKSLRSCLSVGVALSVGLAMLRVLTGLPILAVLLPGYAAAIVLSFFVPNVFTAIAFDSGGVASGPMTATFLLPFAVGACLSVGGDIIADAFGVVAMVAMTPLVTIQSLGLVYRFRRKNRAGEEEKTLAAGLEGYADSDIIPL